jgi:hypothetical protein
MRRIRPHIADRHRPHRLVAVVLLINRGSIFRLRTKRQSVNPVRIRPRPDEPCQKYRLRHLILTRCTLEGIWSVRRRDALLYQRPYARSPWLRVLIYAGNLNVWGSPPFCLDSLRDDRLRDASRLVDGIARISCKSVAAVAENHKGQKAAEYLTTDASLPGGITLFLEAALATLESQRSLVREPICAALPDESDLRGLDGFAPDRLSTLRFARPPIEAFMPRTGRIHHIVQPRLCRNSADSVRRLPSTFSTSRPREFQRKSVIQVEQVVFKPRLLAVTICTHRQLPTRPRGHERLWESI